MQSCYLYFLEEKLSENIPVDLQEKLAKMTGIQASQCTVGLSLSPYRGWMDE